MFLAVFSFWQRRRSIPEAFSLFRSHQWIDHLSSQYIPIFQQYPAEFQFQPTNLKKYIKTAYILYLNYVLHPLLYCSELIWQRDAFETKARIVLQLEDLESNDKYLKRIPCSVSKHSNLCATAIRPPHLFMFRFIFFLTCHSSLVTCHYSSIPCSSLSLVTCHSSLSSSFPIPSSEI